ncbi:MULTISPECIES: helix-turn-helix transcriptional regulator [unclassified Variovorax]|uniref:helix-turn-helix domain-containing protein n=1 Tax=unclassified Variovorax TaxID=663243 RepID=UPI000A00E4A2|nr:MULTISPECIES: helix-turn-helix transcriptional regulator [unclassified Variovorax]PNG49130.1 hypothetical protein CHC06_06367 [Variovorax sp. B2]PNG49515.1 hypothetical protein CHC07_06424 [Variovorax sp. B4]VTV18850.1 Helix-turn-helix [Variovorax sp. WDL1]
MTVPVSHTTKTLRKRFGAWLKAKREEAGMTQLDLADLLDYAYSTTVSQIERGVSSLPPGELERWSLSIRVRPAEMAKTYLYYTEPFLYEALHGTDVYRKEGLPKPVPSITRRNARAQKADGELEQA